MIYQMNLYKISMNNSSILKSKSFMKFIIFGSLITFFSNSTILLMLLILPLSISTFISQILHAYLGYLANKYGVFKRKGKPIVYIFLVLVSWLFQWILIRSLINLGLSSSLAVLIAIPFLATFSFINQKYFVYRK